ncbi:MAG: two-component sensor histidine kinase [Legionellales bacterium]|nr:two-component sensor histidine kinase [Legionellales bacterium]|tara:strand:- start:12956 stop:14395 length:1440 start_codon:yes stop_codon:yes gene_type:complete
MSSKPVRLKRQKLFLQHLSLTARLTILYTVSAFGLLLVSSLLMYSALVENLNHADTVFVNNEIHLVEHLLREYGGEPAGLQEEVVWEPISMNNNYYIRVFDGPQKKLISTPGMDELLPASAFPDAEKVDLESTVYRTQAANKRYYLLKAAWISFYDTGSNKAYLIQVAFDVTRHQRTISIYRARLAIVLILGVILAGIMGTVIARRGLRPLRKLADAMEATSASRLQQRLDTRFWPQEIMMVAEAFNQMVSRLDRSFRQLSQFSADLAHELRTPINNLMGEAEIALSRDRTIDEYQEVLSSGLEELNKLSTLIERLLFLARAENPRTAIQRSQINVREELDAIKEFHEAVAEEKQVAVMVQGEGALNVDPVLFRRAVNNLVSNALKHAEKADKVLLRIETVADGINIIVKDTGTGIPAEHLSQLFNRFYRVDFARSKDAGGTGLGLAIVKSIMDLHDGSVTVASEVNQGTTFTLFFPNK